jgi:hypothetical protein
VRIRNQIAVRGNKYSRTLPRLAAHGVCSAAGFAVNAAEALNHDGDNGRTDVADQVLYGPAEIIECVPLADGLRRQWTNPEAEHGYQELYPASHRAFHLQESKRWPWASGAYRCEGILVTAGLVAFRLLARCFVTS